MRIHTVKQGDTIWNIARSYSVPAAKIIETNELSEPDRLTPGEKLFIFTPTRTYMTRGGDTLEKIALRFGTKKECLLANNPALMGNERIYPGQIISVKYDTPRFGTGVANGYYYGGCSAEKLRRAMPYLSYVTVSSGLWEHGVMKKLFQTSPLIKMLSDENKIPLLRIYAPTGASSLFENTAAFSEKAISMAKNDGYSGITLASRIEKEELSKYREFLLDFKKRLMLENLYLFVELDGNSPIAPMTDISFIADGTVINYAKGTMRTLPDFEDGEERILRDFAERGESQNAFFDIPAFAYRDGEETELSEAKSLARKSGEFIEYDDNTKMCYFDYNRYSGGKRIRSKVLYEAPENINAKLKLLAELGYMGISFDIMRMPIEYLMAFHTSFSCAGGFRGSPLNCRGE